jgi:hypothetical protein
MVNSFGGAPRRSGEVVRTSSGYVEGKNATTIGADEQCREGSEPREEAEKGPSEAPASPGPILLLAGEGY